MVWSHLKALLVHVLCANLAGHDWPWARPARHIYYSALRPRHGEDTDIVSDQYNPWCVSIPLMAPKYSELDPVSQYKDHHHQLGVAKWRMGPRNPKHSTTKSPVVSPCFLVVLQYFFPSLIDCVLPLCAVGVGRCCYHVIFSLVPFYAMSLSTLRRHCSSTPMCAYSRNETYVCNTCKLLETKGRLQRVCAPKEQSTALQGIPSPTCCRRLCVAFISFSGWWLFSLHLWIGFSPFLKGSSSSNPEDTHLLSIHPESHACCGASSLLVVFLFAAIKELYSAVGIYV